jgi:hypothetical protein
MYRAYIRTHDQKVLDGTKTVTTDRDAAAAAFAALVNRTDLDGQKLAATLSYSNRQLAFHRFDRPAGAVDYWRDKLDEIEWPEHGGTREGAGRKAASGEPAKSRTIRLTDSEWQQLQGLGGADWIRMALKQAQP